MLKTKTEKMIMRETWAEIDFDIMLENLNIAKKMIRPRAKIAAVLKANAYGHGAIKTAELLIKNGVNMLAVACLSEAIELRRYFSEIPIMVMGHTEDEHLDVAVEKDIRITIYTLEQAELLSEIGQQLDKAPIVHIKIDTGLNRLGMKGIEEPVNIIAKMSGLKMLNIEGIFTHLALTSGETDKAQYEMFMDVISRLEEKGIYIPIKHICDSIGMYLYPDYHLDMIRLGAFIYGVTPEAMRKSGHPLRMPMTLKTRITQIKEIEKGEGVGYEHFYAAGRKSKVGTLAIGYADGYMRCMAENGEVIVRGKRAPIIGVMCMDQLMIDITDIPEAKPGDEVVLLGGSQISVEELADKVGTNRNEIISIIGRRVPRVYIKDSSIIDIVDYLLD